MGEYLHGWRRKLGCVTLVIACLLLGAWVRSASYCDYLRFKVSGETVSVIWSTSHGFAWILFNTVNPVPFEYAVVPAKETSLEWWMWDWDWRVFGFARGHFYSDAEGLVTVLVFPFGPMAGGFTMLSAWLLLSGPRQKQSAADPTGVTNRTAALQAARPDVGQ